jgi:hypothetical protein
MALFLENTEFSCANVQSFFWLDSEKKFSWQDLKSLILKKLSC